MSRISFPGFDDLDIAELSARAGAKWARAVDEGLLPAWVADMDFPVAPVIRSALHEQIETDLGYRADKAAEALSHRTTSRWLGMSTSGARPRIATTSAWLIPTLVSARLRTTRTRSGA